MLKLRIKPGNIDRNDPTRALLTDTLPADVPIVFSNDGFHANLRNRTASTELTEIIEKLIRSNTKRYTIPHRYRIRTTNTASRQISLAHPAAQYKATLFYEQYAHLIPYFCRRSDVSLRRPTKIGSASFYLSSISERKRYKGAAIDVLSQEKVTRNPGSFFAYSEHDRFYKFFTSDEFIELEKRFSIMRLTDVSKCFASIYSHTLAWAVKDIRHGKETPSAVSFANDFDGLMRFSNYNETNGIPVGAEVSRIFAEVLLQSADASLLDLLDQKDLTHNQHYAIRRYIDDYIIFSNNLDVMDTVQRSLAEALGKFNLHINDLKTHTTHRPLQTKKSHVVAHATIGLAIFEQRLIHFDKDRNAHVPINVRSAPQMLRSLVSDMKAACTNTGVGYDEISPYVIGALANKVEALIESFEFAKSNRSFSRDSYLNVFNVILSALYFFFTVHVTVPASYSLAKATILAIRFFKNELPELSDSLHETVRTLIMELIDGSDLLERRMEDCVPIEIMNIVIASSELPIDFRPDISSIKKLVLRSTRPDYFSYVSLLFFCGDHDTHFVSEAERQLRKKFLPSASPLAEAHDAHFMLDLIACPYLTMKFRMKVLSDLRNSLDLPNPRGFGSTTAYRLRVEEIQKNSWFVNWPQIDLLNHLRKKELSATY